MWTEHLRRVRLTSTEDNEFWNTLPLIFEDAAHRLISKRWSSGTDAAANCPHSLNPSPRWISNHTHPISIPLRSVLCSHIVPKDYFPERNGALLSEQWTRPTLINKMRGHIYVFRLPLRTLSQLISFQQFFSSLRNFLADDRHTPCMVVSSKL